MALSKVLIDDELAREAQAWGEHHEFSARRVAFATLRDHVIADDARACGCAGNDGPVAMCTANRAGQFGASEHRDDATLIAACEEDARDFLDQSKFVRVFAIGAGADADDVHFRAEFAKDGLVRIRHLDGDARRRRKHGDLGVFSATGVFDDFAQNRSGPDLVFGSANGDQRAAMRVRMRGMSFGRCLGVRAGFGLVVRHVARSDTTVR